MESFVLSCPGAFFFPIAHIPFQQNQFSYTIYMEGIETENEIQPHLNSGSAHHEQIWN